MVDRNLGVKFAWSDIVAEGKGGGVGKRGIAHLFARLSAEASWSDHTLLSQYLPQRWHIAATLLTQ